MPTQEIEFFRNDMLSFQGHSPWEGESEVEMNVQKVYRRMVARLTLVEEANEGARSRGRKKSALQPQRLGHFWDFCILRPYKAVPSWAMHPGLHAPTETSPWMSGT